MGHKQSRNQKESKSNYPSGDNSGGQTYLSLLPRVISSGIINPEFLKTFGTSLAIFSTAFFVALITSSSFAPVQNSEAAQQINATLDPTGYYVNVSSNDEVSLNLVTTPDGAAIVGTDTVVTETNSKTGFKLYISSESSAAGSNRLYKDGNSSSEYYISPSAGTVSSATVLDMNTWGYTLANTYGNGDTITSQSRFVGVPLLDSEHLIQTYTEAAPTGHGASVDVYYGIKANTALPVGTYTSKVVYTVLAEGQPSWDGEVSVSPTTSALAGGGTLTITTGLYTNAHDLGEITVTVGGSSCTNVAHTTTASGAINLTCTLPAMTTGWYKDVYVYFPKFGKTYSLKDGIYYAPATLAELDSLSLSDRYMQFMTTPICNAMNESTASNYATNQRQLTDIRDENTYIVRKLKDGNCWMTENLRLTFQDGKALHTNGMTLTTLTSQNSDFTTQDSWDGGNHTSETSANHTVWYSNNANPSNLPKSYTFGDEKSTIDDTNQYKGTVYNWYTVTVSKGTGTMSGGITTEDSICPKGWRLPKGTTESKSYTYLVQGLGEETATSTLSKILTAPYSFIRSNFYNSSTGAVTSVGASYMWTATSKDYSGGATGARTLNLYGGYFDSMATNAVGWGFPARCVSR